MSASSPDWSLRQKSVKHGMAPSSASPADFEGLSGSAGGPSAPGGLPGAPAAPIAAVALELELRRLSLLDRRLEVRLMPWGRLAMLVAPDMTLSSSSTYSSSSSSPASWARFSCVLGPISRVADRVILPPRPACDLAADVARLVASSTSRGVRGRRHSTSFGSVSCRCRGPEKMWRSRRLGGQAGVMRPKSRARSQNCRSESAKGSSSGRVCRRRYSP
mmetsp:Transcript_59842/g.175575  ORF Transcript_59842/g.175575 Transcript_59842/m.175575 type:complete len:218 (-) Transcript_59842:57-710(-)